MQTHRRTRKLSTRSQQLINTLYESGADSGLDSSGEESTHSSEEISELYFITDSTVNMRAFNELDTNIEQLRKEIIHACDDLVRAVEQRKEALLQHVENIRNEKAENLKAEKDNLNYLKPSMLDMGSCLRFVVDEAREDTSLYNMIHEYGCIDEGRASASKSGAKGIGLRFAIADEATQFELITRNNCGETSWVEQDQVDVTIKKENIHQKCGVKNNCNGSYNVFYELHEPGLYEIHVKVNGCHVPDSPFRCNVFEKHNVSFLDDTQDEWTFQNGEKSALFEKNEHQHTSKLYSKDNTSARAWKVRVNTACPKIKVKFGYSNHTKLIPDLTEEYFCKFDLNDLLGNDYSTSIPNHHTYADSHYHKHNRRTKHGKTRERKQSTYHRSSLNFVIFQDTTEKLIHVAAEGTEHEKTTSFKGDLQKLVPFIGIKHFCKNSNCPRPQLVFA
uniref:Tripartite motif containing protein n=1 Tax=Clytia hemisphaerica TaxID=252671 RepID=A0A069DUS7_9CNID